jgi:hypothetical protein
MRNSIVVLGLSALVLMGTQAVAQQKPVANYRGPSPADNALAKRAEASRWRQSDKRTIEGSSTEAVNQFQTPGQGKNCTTQVGAPTPDEDAPTGRFGPGTLQKQVIVVSGSIINICK